MGSIALEVAAGSVIGADHTRAGKNGHDAFTVLQESEILVAVIADGCGSGAHSEVGAKLGTRILAEHLMETLRPAYSIQSRLGKDEALSITGMLSDSSSLIWSKAREHTLRLLGILVEHMSGRKSVREVVENHFLFTLLGVVVVHDHVTIFALGDGMVVLNDEVIYQGEFEGNAPPYLAYGGLVNSTINNPELFNFRVLRQLPLDMFSNVLIGTDGLDDFVRSAELALPGTNKLLGSLSQFWTEDRYFRNPDMVRRTLALCNREVVHTDADGNILHGKRLLSDDTTIVVVRKSIKE